MEGNNQSTSNTVETSNKPSVWPILIVALLLIGGGVYFFMNSRSGAVTEPNSTTSPANTTENTVTQGSAEEFSLEGSNFKFSVTEMRVKQGDTVKVTFKSAGGMHDFVLDEFDVKTNVLKDGAEETVTFVADKLGEFEYYCSVGQHRQMGMVGKLIVE